MHKSNSRDLIKTLPKVHDSWGEWFFSNAAWVSERVEQKRDYCSIHIVCLSFLLSFLIWEGNSRKIYLCGLSDTIDGRT